MQKSGGKEEWTVSPDLKCIEKICRIQQLWMLCNSTGRCIVTLQSVLCIVCVFLFFWHNSLTYIQNPLKSKSFWSSFLSSWSKPWKWLRLKHSSETEICLLNPEGFQWRCICSLGSFLHPAPNWNQPHKEDYTNSKQQLQKGHFKRWKSDAKVSDSIDLPLKHSPQKINGIFLQRPKMISRMAKPQLYVWKTWHSIIKKIMQFET